MKESKYRATYFGGPVTGWEFRTGSAMSERVIFEQNNDTGAMTWRHIKGDGRTPEFVKFGSGEWAGGPDVDAMRECAASLLGVAA